MFVPKKTFVKLVGIVLAICSCLSYTSIAQAKTHAHSRTSSVCSQRWTSGAYYGNVDWTVHFADVNGDGKTDAIVVNNTGVYVALSTGSSFTTPQKWTSGAYYGNMDNSAQFADVNGDGRADAIVVNQDGVSVALSTGFNSFTTAHKWTSGAYYGNVDWTVHFANVNGDGGADAIVVNHDGLTVAIATWGTYFDTIQKWKVSTRDAYYGNMDSTVHFADLNGDYLPEAIVVNKDGIYAAPGTGSNFFNEPQKLTDSAYYGDMDSTVHFADVNGDGKADAIVVNLDGVHVALGAGSSFGC